MILLETTKAHLKNDTKVTSSNTENQSITTFLFAFHLANIQGLYSTYDREMQIRDSYFGIHVEMQFIKYSGL